MCLCRLSISAPFDPQIEMDDCRTWPRTAGNSCGAFSCLFFCASTLRRYSWRRQPALAAPARGACVVFTDYRQSKIDMGILRLTGKPMQAERLLQATGWGVFGIKRHGEKQLAKGSPIKEASRIEPTGSDTLRVMQGKTADDASRGLYRPWTGILRFRSTTDFVVPRRPTHGPTCSDHPWRLESRSGHELGALPGRLRARTGAPPPGPSPAPAPLADRFRVQIVGASLDTFRPEMTSPERAAMIGSLSRFRDWSDFSD